MAILVSDQPVSPVQRRVNWGALLLSGLSGVTMGLWAAKECASFSSGYVADYEYASVFFLAVALGVLGLLLLIHWRTRWIGSGLILAGILSFVAFHCGMAILLREDRVAWVHEKMVAVGSDQKASAVIYFRPGVTDDQVDDFDSSVLQGPAEPRHAGRDYPSFVHEYLRLSPLQANGHKAVALTFFGSASDDETGAYMAKIKSDSRVERVFLDTVPSSIHIDSELH